ncbi:hypothetical protein BDV96DRAFT_651625 [Lophiotrema nucula]|uniref:Uncharacterized protein n=1 Tax=Lophiotrema nucula TaxID=690887 RepID=A0A6A5YRA0_9PLEO|nr:hypothetical protein BDV96DRAFT_651625 [Lophiotrema nucula]
MSDRINRTSTGVYDQVVALTQQLINDTLSDLYLHIFKTAPGTLRFDLTRCDGSGLANAELGPPRVAVGVEVGGINSMMYQITIKSGTLKMWLTQDSKNPSLLCYKVSNWQFAVPAYMIHTDLSKTSSEYNEVRQRMNQPGDYTIHQLALTLLDAQLGEPYLDFCSFGEWSPEDYIVDASGNQHFPPGEGVSMTRTWFDFPPIVQILFPDLLQDVAKIVAVSGLNVLGYAATTEHPTDSTSRPSVLTPAAVKFQTYPWIDENNRDKYIPRMELTGKCELNYLLFLENLGSSMPPMAPFLEQPNGNWTSALDPAADADPQWGSVVLSGRNFIGSVVAPKLTELNRWMAPVVNSVKVNIDYQEGDVPIWWKLTTNWEAVIGPTSGSYSLSKGSSKGWKGFESLTDEAVEWVCKSEQPEVKAHDTSLAKWIDGYGNSSIFVRLYVLPGETTMTLEGRADLRFKNKWYTQTHGDSETSWVCSWKIVFTLQSLNDGGLYMDISKRKLNIESSGTEGLTFTQSTPENPWKATWANFDGKLNEMHNLLQWQDRFYFPPKGTFALKNPMFDHLGNVICDIKYRSATTLDDSCKCFPRPVVEPTLCTVMPPNIIICRSELAGSKTSAVHFRHDSASPKQSPPSSPTLVDHYGEAWRAPRGAF